MSAAGAHGLISRATSAATMGCGTSTPTAPAAAPLTAVSRTRPLPRTVSRQIVPADAPTEQRVRFGARTSINLDATIHHPMQRGHAGTELWHVSEDSAAEV